MEQLDINKRVKLSNLFDGEIGERVRAKKHLTIGYVINLVDDFMRRAYIAGQQDSIALPLAEKDEELRISNQLIETYELEMERLKDRLSNAESALVKAVNAAQPQTIHYHSYNFTDKPELTRRANVESILGKPPYTDYSKFLREQMEFSILDPEESGVPGSHVDIERVKKPTVKYHKSQPVREFNTWALFHEAWGRPYADDLKVNGLISIRETGGKVYQIQNSNCELGEIINLKTMLPLLYSDLTGQPEPEATPVQKKSLMERLELSTKRLALDSIRREAKEAGGWTEALKQKFMDTKRDLGLTDESFE